MVVVRPMLASPGVVIPSGPGWVHEVKWDGMRVLAGVSDGRVRLTTRNENEVTGTFPELGVLAGLDAPGGGVLLDGEVVVLDGGVPSFAALGARMHVTNTGKARRLAVTSPVTFMVFDVLAWGGVDLTGCPLSERRALLEGLVLPVPAQVPVSFTDGPALHAATLEQGLEGVVSKRLTSRYLPGSRSSDWLKFPHRGTLSLLIGGWRLETGSRNRLGSVLVGAPTTEGLVYLGRVGSGLAGKVGARLQFALAGLEVAVSPFVDLVPGVDAQRTMWVTPELVVEVRALGVSVGRRLRHPAFHGLRPDLTPDVLPLVDLSGAVAGF
ncbi:non-homologous end-joining DNA ligase [Tessaracoccus sp.]